MTWPPVDGCLPGQAEDVVEVLRGGVHQEVGALSHHGHCAGRGPPGVVRFIFMRPQYISFVIPHTNRTRA
jgi:hypothetical protein